jgi:hypothetical protein
VRVSEIDLVSDTPIRSQQTKGNLLRDVGRLHPAAFSIEIHSEQRKTAADHDDSDPLMECQSAVVDDTRVSTPASPLDEMSAGTTGIVRA